MGPKIGLMNGEFYEVFNTPKTYFLDIVIYRLPFYFSLLIIISYLLIFTGNLFKKNQIKYFNQKFLVINIIAFFPIILSLILSVNIYDNLRLFLFIIPFFSLIAAFSLNKLFNTFKSSWISKNFLIVVLILFSLSFYRFILLTPYQYNYVNYSFLKYGDSKEKWEHDYWGSSYKELVTKIEKKYSRDEIKNFKITNCSGDGTLLYYLVRKLGLKKIYRSSSEIDQVTHVVLINRSTLDVFNSNIYPKIKHLVDLDGIMLKKDMEYVVRFPGIQTVCPKQYKGTDEVVVTRNGVPLSIFRKLD